MVVVLIILLVSAVVLPMVIPALAHRQVTEAARILQAGLVQARAAAVKAGAPRGIRLLPDPTYANSQSILAYNRWVAIEPGPDYSNGHVVIWPVYDAIAFGNGLPAPAAIPYAGPYGGIYPYLPQALRTQVYGAQNVNPPGQVLMIEQAPFLGNNSTLIDNPTSWFWNVRIGDTIQINGAGRSYTVIGPMTVPNPELFANDGPAGNAPQLIRQYTDTGGATGNNVVRVAVEYLFVVNGEDDDLDGFIDNGWDGFDNNYNNLPGTLPPAIDELLEWTEIEQWVGAERQLAGSFSSYMAAVGNSTTGLPTPQPYTITRRPVPSPGARETALPQQVVIDATSWNSTRERSRLPIDPKSFYVDVLINPNGQAVVQTEYSSPTSNGAGSAFFHFWLAERQDVHELTDLWSGGTNPNAPAANFLLPLPAAFYTGLNTVPSASLLGERMLVTYFTRTGQIEANSVEFFNALDVNAPFYDSQLGAREAK